LTIKSTDYINRTFKLLNEFLNIKQSKEAFEKLETLTFGIKVDNEWGYTENGRIIATTCFKLLVRMVNNISVYVNKDLSAEEEWVTLLNNWRDEALNQAHPVHLTYSGPCNILLVVGNETLGDDTPVVQVVSNGWEANIGKCLPIIHGQNSKTNPIGACLAAALGVAEMFKHALSNYLEDANVRFTLHESLTISAYTNKMGSSEVNPDLPEKLNIGTVHMVGAGAIGNAFAYTLSLFQQLEGQLIVIDADKVDLSNLNRYLLSTSLEVNHRKVDIINKSLAKTGLKINGFFETWFDFTRHFGRQYDTVISTVDTAETRREIQSDLPRIILDGATSGFTFSISRHTFLEGACLGCIHLPNPDEYAVEEEMARILGWPIGEVFESLRTDRPLSIVQLKQIEAQLNLTPDYLSSFAGKPLRALWAKEICGRVELIRDDDNVIGTTGFVSIVPGILLVGELVKERYFQTNVLDSRIHYNVLVGPTRHSLQKPEKETNCACYCSDPIMKESYTNKHYIV
jgi:molybdopterin/thiamine biosynthesis adenylyltransferase